MELLIGQMIGPVLLLPSPEGARLEDIDAETKQMEDEKDEEEIIYFEGLFFFQIFIWLTGPNLEHRNTSII